MIKYLIFLVVMIMGILIYVWSGSRNLTDVNLVVNNGNGDLQVININSDNGEITSIVIPGSTQLTVSRQLGNWKAMSLWQLGINENLSGQLMQETVLRNFSFPVTYWAEEKVLGLTQRNPLVILRTLILPYKSNLTWKDKVKIGFFNLMNLTKPRTELNLDDFSVLRKTKLIDGENGYLVVGDIPPKLMAIFSNRIFSQKEIRVLINNRSGSPSVAEKVGRIVEVLGAKVSSIVKEDPVAIDCQVSGKDKLKVELLKLLFACSKGSTDQIDNFDIVIDIGEKFIRRF